MLHDFYYYSLEHYTDQTKSRLSPILNLLEVDLIESDSPVRLVVHMVNKLLLVHIQLLLYLKKTNILKR